MPETSGSSRLVWFTSSYSNGAGGECVECALTDGGALVRDSKIPEAHVIAVGSGAWRSFLQTVKHGSAAPPSHLRVDLLTVIRSGACAGC